MKWLFAGLPLVHGLIHTLAIVLGIVSGQDNIYTIPEFYPGANGEGPFPSDGKNWMHAGAHIIFAGALALPIFSWAISSLLLVIARRVKSW